jgi:DNA polymerase elongation subunit (family B)
MSKKKAKQVLFREPEILGLDIETSLMTAYTFSLWPKYIPIEDVIDDWRILCISYSINNEEPIELKGTERSILRKISKVINNADMVLHHNGTKFDMKRINTRLLIYGLPPVKYFKAGEIIDTLKVAKKEFNFSSNKLDFIATALGVDNKLPTNKQLWIDATNGCKDALNRMSTYCAQDVKVLWDVYKRLRPHATNHPNMGHYSEIPVCPNCGSEHIQKRGFTTTRVSKKQRYQCMDCGAWSEGKTAIGASTEIR